MYIKHREPFYKSLLYHVVLCSCLPLLLYHALIIAKRIIILAAWKNASIHCSLPWHERAKALKSISLLWERNDMENVKETNASTAFYGFLIFSRNACNRVGQAHDIQVSSHSTASLASTHSFLFVAKVQTWIGNTAFVCIGIRPSSTAEGPVFNMRSSYTAQPVWD